MFIEKIDHTIAVLSGDKMFGVFQHSSEFLYFEQFQKFYISSPGGRFIPWEFFGYKHQVPNGTIFPNYPIT